MDKNIYEQLQENIDQYSIGMPVTKSGIEMKILKSLFTEDEARIYLGLSSKLESPKTIANRLNLEEDNVAAALEKMTEKGLTFPKTENALRYFAAAPFMHGIFEHQAYRVDKDKELVQLMDEYIVGEYSPKYTGMRTIPLNVKLNPELPVLPYDDVREIIKSKEKIGIIPCACADHAALLGHRCDCPKHVCIVFGYYAEYIIEDMKVGRWVNQEEALKVLDETEKIGLVHQTGGNSKSTECICNCCPDCCTGLRKIKALKRPARAVVSNYYADLDSKLCSYCELCMERCPMDAIINKEEFIAVDRNRCIGCGLCTTNCPMEAIALKVKPMGIQSPPDSYLFMRSTGDLERELADEVKTID